MMFSRIHRVLTAVILLWGQTALAAVPTSVARLRDEPAIKDVQQAALRFFGVDKDEIDSMKTRAAIKALLPKLSVSAGHVVSDATDDTINQEFSATQVWVARGTDGTATDIRGQATWNLPLLMFNPEELDVLTLGESRQRVIKEVTTLYFDRRRLQVDMMLSPPTDAQTKITKELRLEELTSLIDAMTGGWFGKEMAAD